jgi:tetratricopeptide (TPR) repeat protein
VTAAADDSPAALAIALADQDAWPPAAERDPAATRAIGWALKELCFASWSSDPPRAVRAALGVRRLRDISLAAVGLERTRELDALAAWTGGVACLVRGEMDDAITQLDAAAAGFAALGQPLHAAQSHVPKIMALTMRGRTEEAVRCAQDTQRALLEHGDDIGASKVSLNLGSLHLRCDCYAQAVPCYRQASELFARAGAHEHEIMAEIGLADALSALGVVAQAAQTYERARTRATEHGLPVLQAVADESMALLDLARGRYRDALTGMERARQGYTELDMPQHLAIADKQLADAYLELRLLPEAIAGFDAAIQRFRALGMHVDEAWTLVQRGRALALSGRARAAGLALTQGAALFAAHDNTAGVASVALARAELALADDDAAQALALAEEAAAVFARAGMLERQLRAQVVSAQALLRQGSVPAARKLFDSTLSAAQSQQLAPIGLRCMTGRAMTSHAVGELAAARADLEGAVEIFEAQRRALPGDELRGAFQSDHLQPFHELLRMTLDGLDAAGEQGAVSVLQQLERVRARTLSDRLVAGQTGAEAVAEATEGLRTRLAWLHRRLHRLQEESGTSLAVSEQIRACERELLEHARRARLAGDSDGAPQEDLALDVDLLCRQLGAGDALVEYGVLDGELFACVATHEGVQVQRRMASWREVLEAVRAARFQIDSLRLGRQRLRAHESLLLQRACARLRLLHELVWQPIAPWLRGRERVLIVPHAQLGALPFCALHDEGGWIGQHHQLAMAPSARVALRGLVREQRTPRSVLALGESSRLPHAADEAQAVVQMLPQGSAYVGPDASLARLREHGPGADVVHLACHAQFRSDNPVFSALHLHDGALTAEAIEALHFDGAIIVLSGCETALNDASAGDEGFGLARAFLLAGAQRVLASLWAVDDATTAGFMRDFYSGLGAGQSAASALRAAQAAARQRDEHPLYWAAFALIGGW